MAPGDAVQVGLELPETESDAFRSYASSVIDGIVPDWPATATKLPEPPLALESMVPRPFSTADRDALLAWVLASFDEVGKERSLFFVQSLACIGRTHQLSGNKPLVIRSASSVHLADCSVYNACLLAASLACVREQGKVDDIARIYFSPDKQLTLLTWLALSSSAAPALNAALPTPAERAQQVFGIDPVNETEQFTAVIRQAYKHALLFAARDTSGPVGDWRPAFLSEWVRCALLVRAWLGRLSLATGDERKNLFAIVCRAERSRTAFQHIFADLADSSEESRAEDLALELVRNATEGSPEACSNYWALISGLSEKARGQIVSAPSGLTPGTDLSEMLFEGISIGPALSGVLGIFSGAEFVGCTLSGISFESCDFSRATFQNCTLSKVTFGECDGPIAFEGCHFADCALTNGRSPALPTYAFNDCTFIDCTIVQTSPALPTALSPVALFADCRASNSSTLLSGDWSGFSGGTISGLSPTQGPTAGDLAEITLVRLLRPFFPSHAGTAGESQARGYIRSSAIGRGVLPDGAPLTGALTQILLSEGFTTGGRSGHIYAPWSSVAGVTNRALRSELAAFMRNREQGAAVKRLLARIRREADWQV